MLCLFVLTSYWSQRERSEKKIKGMIGLNAVVAVVGGEFAEIGGQGSRRYTTGAEYL